MATTKEQEEALRYVEELKLEIEKEFGIPYANMSCHLNALNMTKEEK